MALTNLHAYKLAIYLEFWDSMEGKINYEGNIVT